MKTRTDAEPTGPYADMAQSVRLHRQAELQTERWRQMAGQLRTLAGLVNKWPNGQELATLLLAAAGVADREGQ